MILFKALDTAEEWAFIKVRAHVIACEDSQGIVAYNENGIQAVCVADCFSVDNCHVHVAIDNPLVIKHGFFEEVFRHLFITNNLKRVFGMVPAGNIKALKLDAHIGFIEVGRLPHGWATGVDMVAFCMERDDCRWIRHDVPEKQEAA